MLMTSAIAQAAFPSLAELHRLGDQRVLLNQYWRLQEVVSFTTAAVFAVAPFATPPVFRLLFGPAEADAMFLPCTLLALGFYMNSTLNLPYMLALAVGRPGIPLALNAWALLAVLPLTVLLVRLWGLDGAALSWVVYHIFAYLYFVPRVCNECADGRIGGWYLIVARFLATAVTIYAVAWLVAVAAAGPSALWLAVAYGAGTAVYAAAGWRLLSEEVRVRLRALLASTAPEARHGVWE
jgi:O-antigen/teichoic acid export membrane protein